MYQKINEDLWLSKSQYLLQLNIPAWAAGTIVDTTLPSFIDQGVKS
jgi:hypothetical protein